MWFCKLHLGLVLGVSSFGIIADRYGRMYSFKSSVVISAFAAILLLFSVNFLMTGFSLIILGIGMGGELTVGGTVFCEFCPPSKLYYLTYMSFFWSLGGIIAALVAFITILLNVSFVPIWRIVVACGCIFELTCLAFRFYLKETPAYYISKKDYKSAEKVLDSISMENTSQHFLLEPPKNSKQSLKSSITEEKKEASVFKLISKLFNKTYIKVTVGLCLVIFN